MAQGDESYLDKHTKEQCNDTKQETLHPKSNKNTNNDASHSPIKPYGRWNHPALSWLESLVNIIICWILRFSTLRNMEPSSKSQETMEQIQKVRTAQQKGNSEAAAKGPIQKWEKHANSPIVEATIYVTRNENILQDWGIVKNKVTATFMDQKVEVSLQFPASAAPKLQIDTKQERNVNGTIKTTNVSLQDLPEDIPFMVSYHGGGFVIGNHTDIETIMALSDLCEDYSKEHEAGKIFPPMIVASVKYSLAPEHPFPSGIIDCLSVLEHIFETTSRKIHITGVSAGGALALVTTLEAHRKYPGRVSSVMSIVPMIDPNADSPSYIQNCYASQSIMHLVQWSWRAYLGLNSNDNDRNSSSISNRVDETDIPNLDNNYMTTVLSSGFRSNRLEWEASPWKTTHKDYQRLIKPICDLPNDLDKPHAPEISIVTAKADVLHNDGMELAMALENDCKAKVVYFASNGSHIFCFLMNKESYKKRHQMWSKNLHLPTPTSSDCDKEKSD